ncbi:hypothetical protein [Haloferax sp. DFSO52]|uniref:hypothetical protein n=1 Tax=Haloferax sp. DFSO52 TaxID=3388505 RepID=UPI003A8A9155
MQFRGGRFGRIFAVVIVAFVVLVAAQSAGLVSFSGHLLDGDVIEPDGVEEARDVHLVPVGDGQDRLWPFTSRARSFDTLTLPINVVVEGNPARVRSLLLYSYDAKWDETNESWQFSPGEQVPEDGVNRPWGSATGADRYTYVDTGESGGTWIDESMQLHDGTYFGSRIHLRLYGGGGPEDSWTAIQAHRDYWDWFRLRHTVTSLDEPQHAVERDLMKQPTVVEIKRERFGNGNIIDSDGWVSVVKLAPRQLVSDTPLESQQSVAEQPVSGPTPASVERPRSESHLRSGTVTVGPALSTFVFVFVGVGGVFAAIFNRERVGAAIERLRWSRLADPRYQRTFVLLLTLVAIPILVRSASLFLEGTIPNHPKVIAGVLYPIFALAPPLAALRIPRDLSAELWFAVAFLGYGIGLVADFELIGVGVIPIDIVLHRFFVLVSLGLLAVVGMRRSSSRKSHTLMLPAAVSLWISLLLWPLFLGI